MDKVPSLFSFEVVEMIITALVAIGTSSGFWVFITKRQETKDLGKRLLIGLAHDRIIALGMQYIQRGSISQDEYENLHDYLFMPYKEMGGNGSAERIMKAVECLPIRPNFPKTEEVKNGC